MDGAAAVGDGTAPAVGPDRPIEQANTNVETIRTILAMGPPSGQRQPGRIELYPHPHGRRPAATARCDTQIGCGAAAPRRPIAHWATRGAQRPKEGND